MHPESILGTMNINSVFGPFFILCFRQSLAVIQTMTFYETRYSEINFTMF
jgi:hypothetical protein